MEKKEERPWCMITEMDQYLFGQGTHYEIYKKLGAHLTEYEGEKGVYFAVWAPHAKGVRVVGEFNCWGSDGYRMNRLEPLGIYEVFVPGLEEGCMYKYLIETEKGDYLYKADPFAFYAEKRPGTASRVADISGFTWHDDRWMTKRAGWNAAESPMSIYEVHPGSWKRHPHEEDEDGFYNYRELAAELTEYIKKMGYTHIELMGIAEHPFDGSWGYQVTGYFAPTSRYGTPEDFQYMIDYFHKHNIGVILDWVPAHFPKDENGLARFDGTCLYEHLDPRQGEHPHWGTLIYNYGRPQVVNFLIANALFWVKRYHADGIRMDAVASMLYLDYGKKDGEWVANMYGSNENLEAIEMLKNLSEVFHKECPGAWLIAEESTAWPKVTANPADDGLGFDLKWNMGWMNDFISYMQTDPLFRKGRHGMLTFSMIYAYSESFILVLSHDEVVHLKGSMYAKMPGDEDQKFANLRAAYGFMMMHPGKKLLFMGQEFGQTTEWNEKESLPWNEAEDTEHQKLQHYVAELNAFYQAHPALYEMDNKEDGFEWLSSMDADHSIITFMRYSEEKQESLLVICNFTPVLYENFKVGVPHAGKYKEIFNSDAEVFGGSGHGNPRQKRAKAVSWDGREYSISIEVPPLGISVFKYIEK